MEQYPDITYRKIIGIALPMLIANISIPLLGLVDTVILGHLDDAIYLGSVALGSHIISLLFWSFGFLRMGTTGFTARAKGEGNQDSLYSTLIQSVGFGFIAASILLLLSPFYLPLLFEWLADDGDLRNYAYQYADIRMWGVIPTLMTYGITGWLIGLQKMRQAMLIFISINVINMLLDYWLIVVLDMNVAGAAWATLVAEYCGLLIGLCIIGLYYRDGIKTIAWSLVFKAATIKQMLVSSQQLFVRTLCLLSVFLFFTSQGVSLGSDIAAANAVLLNLLSLAAYTLDSFAYSSETLCGETWGARHFSRFKQACKRTTELSAISALGITLVLMVGQPWIITLYTDIESVKIAINEVYLLLAVIPIIGIWSYQLDGIYIGIGKTQTLQNMMLLSTLAIYFPLWWLLTQILSDYNLVLWLSFIGFMLARGVTLGAVLIYSRYYQSIFQS